MIKKVLYVIVIIVIFLSSAMISFELNKSFVKWVVKDTVAKESIK